ncbi:MAG: basic amino acid ABC transporter substrate-binding protein [Hespellia sp.]|nr:basic amino acid ABC transporter substrate-binding protein [Hespellia sp.]
MKKRMITTMALTLSIIVSLAACGEKKDNAGVDDGKIVVGTNAEYEPFEYLDEDGNLQGFDIELMNAVAERADMEIEWIDMAFDSLIGSMEAGNVEMIAAAIGPTAEREKSCDFSEVYYSGYQSIVTVKGTEYKTFEELKGKTIAVLEGSMSDMIASGENQDYGEVEAKEVKRFKNATQAIQELENGAADAVITDAVIADKFVTDRDGALTGNEVEGTGEDSVFAIKKGDTKLVETINKALKELQDDGTYDEIYNKYFAE